MLSKLFQKRSRNGFILCLVCSLLLVLPQRGFSQGALPGWMGVIDNPGSKNIILRENPPTVTPTSYNLSDRICSIGDGTEFEVTKELQVLNGEKWYGITIPSNTSINNPIGCPSRRPLTGWIVGQFSDGQRVVNLFPPDSQQQDPPSSPEYNEPEQVTPEEEALLDQADQVEREKTGQGLGFLKYLYLSVGSFFGLLVITVEREDSRADFSLMRHVFKSPFFWYRTLVLVFVNIIFVGLIVETFGTEQVVVTPEQISSGNLIPGLLRMFSGNNWGAFIGGFILSILILRFMSFTEKD